VSILIPARNEEANIANLLNSILGQDYKDFEVIVYDDQSSDNTYAICSQFASEHANISVIKGGEIPNGWLGKNHACHQLSKKAKGKYLLFLDADTILEKRAINSAIHRLQLNNLGLLSVFPNQVMQTIGEKTTVPLLHYLLLNLLPLRLVFLIKSPVVATACGQFMLFDGDMYRQHQWHEQAKDKIVEDAEIMKLVKLAKYNGEVLLANGMVNCRMYRSYGYAIDGFSKNALAAFNYNIIALFTYILVLVGAPMIIIMTLDFNLILYIVGLIVLTRVMISFSSGQNVLYNILLHPVQIVNLVIIAFLSVQKHLTRTVTWKGRSVY